MTDETTDPTDDTADVTPEEAPSEPVVLSRVEGPPRPVIPVRLGSPLPDGTDDETILYARRPKDYAVAFWASTTDPLRVLRDVFRESPASYDHIIARLDDPADELDVEELKPLLNLVEAHSTGRPTRKGSGSGRSSTTRKSGQRSKAGRR